MNSYRSSRVSSVLKRELALIIQGMVFYSESGADPLMFTVVEVRQSRDNKTATVWVSILGEKSKRTKALDYLKQNAGKIRYQLAQNVTLKHTPELHFNLDETLDNAERIDTILRDEGLI